MSPQPASLSSKTSSSARKTDVLARESAHDTIGLNSVRSQSFGGNLSNIVIDRHPRPVFTEDALGLGVDLDKGDRLEAACALQAEVKPTNASEQ